jgi:hypothetical protein
MKPATQFHLPPIYLSFTQECEPSYPFHLPPIYLSFTQECEPSFPFHLPPLISHLSHNVNLATPSIYLLFTR